MCVSVGVCARERGVGVGHVGECAHVLSLEFSMFIPISVMEFDIAMANSSLYCLSCLIHTN